MKRLAAILVLVMLAGVFGPCMVANAAPFSIPHEDPSTADSTLDSLSFLSEYANIFALMSARQYENASLLSAQLSQITVPADLSYVISRYNDLTQQLITQLNDLENTLNRASSLLDQYRLVDARQEIDHAGVVVAKAQILLGDLEDATLTISQRLGVLATPAESKTRQAYAELQGMLDRLKDLIDQYYNLLERANQRFEDVESENLTPTTVTLRLNASSCFVGETISAAGTLSVNGGTMAGRAVTLLLDDKEVATVTTQADGSYHAAIMIPHKYVSSMSLKTVFSPSGNDRGMYLGSSSSTAKLEVLFYRTALDVSVANIAYPGLSLTVKGNVSSQGGTPLEGRQIQVRLDNIAVSEQVTDEKGTFTAEVPISAGAKLGNHTLSVTVAPKGVYAGATIQRTLTIQKMPTYVELNTPSFVLLPLTLQINGTVQSESNRLKNASVLVEYANTSTTVKTLSDGTFNLTLDMSLSTFFAGNQEIKVTVQPAEPWQAYTQKNMIVYALNSVSIAVMVTAILAIVFIFYNRLTKNSNNKKGMNESAKAVFVAAEKKEVANAEPVSALVKFEDLKGRVLKAYADGLEIVQSASGCIVTSNMTLREFLQISVSKSSKAFALFSELTSMAERTLYSSTPMTQKDAENAEELANKIRRILSGVA